MRRTLLPLLLSAACLLFVASPRAEARRQPYRVNFPPRPVYPGVHVYPQVVTTPAYTAPYYYGYPYSAPYVPRLYGGYTYNPGSYYYSVSPYGGASYYYTNPSFYYWYRFR
jgi:hypothetical protein